MAFEHQNRLNGHERRAGNEVMAGQNALYSFVQLLGRDSIYTSLRFRIEERRRGVKLLTIHQAKGL